MKRVIQDGCLGTWASRYSLPIFNSSSDPIPPYAVAQVVTGSQIGTTPFYAVYIPTGVQSAQYVVTTPEKTPAISYGAATNQFPCPAAIIGLPVINQEIGPVAGSWAMSTSGKGYIYLGGLNNGVGRVGIKAGATAGDDFPLVRIKNVSGSQLGYGSISGYGTPLDPPPSANRIKIFQSLPPQPGLPFCVLLGDLPNTAIGDAAPLGIVDVQLNYTDLTHAFADAVSSNYQTLTSSVSGAARIVWRANQGVVGSATLGPQAARVSIEPPPRTQDIRAISYSTISAARGVLGGPVTPGVGLAQLYGMPSGPAGTSWDFRDSPVTVENSMFGKIDPNKPIQLKLSRLDDTGKQIYVVSALGCAGVPSGSG